MHTKSTIRWWLPHWNRWLVLISITLPLTSTPLAYATSVSPPSFRERILTADYIILAKATQLEILDAAGKPIAPPPNGNIENGKFRLTIKTIRTLKNLYAANIPKTIQVTYSVREMISYQWEHDYFVGKKHFYLFRGPDFSILDDWGFTELEEAEPQIKELLEKSKLAH